MANCPVGQQRRPRDRPPRRNALQQRPARALAVTLASAAACSANGPDRRSGQRMGILPIRLAGRRSRPTTPRRRTTRASIFRRPAARPGEACLSRLRRAEAARSCPSSLPVRRSTQATLPLSDQTKPVTLAPSMSISIPSRSTLSVRQRLRAGGRCRRSVGPRRPKQRNGNAHDQRENGDHARNDGDSAQRDDPPSELVAAFGSSGGGRLQCGHGHSGRRLTSPIRSSPPIGDREPPRTPTISTAQAASRQPSPAADHSRP